MAKINIKYGFFLSWAILEFTAPFLVKANMYKICVIKKAPKPSIKNTGCLGSKMSRVSPIHEKKKPVSINLAKLFRFFLDWIQNAPPRLANNIGLQIRLMVSDSKTHATTSPIAAMMKNIMK